MSLLSQVLKCLNGKNGIYLRNNNVVFNMDQKWILQSLFKVQAYRFGSTATTNEFSQQNKVSVARNPTQSSVMDDAPKMSKAMKTYIERAKQHDALIKTESHEYEIGRRHLANMMGEDPETFTQEDINQAIAYLMPSGLFEEKARPKFEHPNIIFPKRKEAEFDFDGRPFHCLFYCKRANYYQVLHDTSEHFIQLNKYEDKMIASGILHPDISNKVNVDGTRFINKKEFEKTIIESIQDRDYDQLIIGLKKLVEHPYSARVNDFIMKYRMPLVAVTLAMDIPPLKYEENKRPYMDAVGYRKRTIANVIVRGNGTGKLDINGMDIQFFDGIQEREQLLFPLHFTGLLDRVDVEATVHGVGPTARAGAIRHGLSLALRSFVSSDMIERMRLAGLLTRDRRTKERKKPGQEGARRKFTWKKR